MKINLLDKIIIKVNKKKYLINPDTRKVFWSKI